MTLFTLFAASALLSAATASAQPASQTAAPATPKPAAAAPAKPAAAKPSAAAPAAPKRDQLWFIAKAADGAIGYDAKSIAPNPALSTVDLISVVYIKAGIKSASGKPYYFVLAEDTLDCIGPQFKPKSRLVFDDQGKLIDGADAPAAAGWSPLTGNPPLQALRSVACTGATFKNLQQAPSFEAAVTLMKGLK